MFNCSVQQLRENFGQICKKKSGNKCWFDKNEVPAKIYGLCESIYLTFCPSVCKYFYLYMFLSIYLSISIYLIYLYFFLSISMKKCKYY